MAKAYYNEFDPYAAQWLRNLIKAGLIAPGDVDERDIRDVKPSDLTSYSQVHLFAGIGGWSAALRLAGWPDDRPVWTGSAPCQPFSAAGRQVGLADERHLWPAFHHLIQECKPPVVFGEQVEAAIKHGWLDLIQDDLEGIGYAFGAACVPAAGIGAPHIRQRLWFVAERLANGDSVRQHQEPVTGLRDSQYNFEPCSDPGRLADQHSEQWYGSGCIGQGGRSEPPNGSTTVRLGDSNNAGLEGQSGNVDGARGRADAAGPATEAGAVSRLADRCSERRQQNTGGAPRHEATDGRAGRHGCEPHRDHEPASDEQVHGEGQPGPTNGFWRTADWLLCRDGKWRPVESGSFPLVDGSAFRVGSGSTFEGKSRVGMLRGYGNAIVSQVAAEIISSYKEITMKK